MPKRSDFDATTRGADYAIDLLVRHLQPFASGNDGDPFVAPPVVGFGERPDSRGKLFGHALGLAAWAPRVGRRSCMPARAGIPNQSRSFERLGTDYFGSQACVTIKCGEFPNVDAEPFLMVSHTRSVSCSDIFVWSGSTRQLSSW
jgi:hypothetical protein